MSLSEIICRFSWLPVLLELYVIAIELLEDSLAGKRDDPWAESRVSPLCGPNEVWVGSDYLYKLSVVLVSLWAVKAAVFAADKVTDDLHERVQPVGCAKAEDGLEL